MDPTTTHLLTVAGAAPAIVLLVQFAKALGLPTGACRPLALLLGAIGVPVVTVANGAAATLLVLLPAVLVGIEAGMAAWGMYDVASKPGEAGEYLRAA